MVGPNETVESTAELLSPPKGMHLVTCQRIQGFQELMILLVSNVVFLLNEKYYKQVDGVAMVLISDPFLPIFSCQNLIEIYWKQLLAQYTSGTWTTIF